jgi:hypothetical protein
MSTHQGRRALLLAVFTVVFLAVAGPTLDVLLFGLHEHVAAAAHAKGESAPVNDLDGPARHHCDIGMNPAEVAPVFELIAPLPAAESPAEPLFSALASRPFVPYTPPRA